MVAPTHRFSSGSRPSLGRLHRLRHGLQGFRHDLLVGVRLVNRVEKEIHRAELEQWLGKELQMCGRVTELLRSDTILNAPAVHSHDHVQQRLLDYCGSCREVEGSLSTDHIG